MGYILLCKMMEITLIKKKKKRIDPDNRKRKERIHFYHVNYLFSFVVKSNYSLRNKLNQISCVKSSILILIFVKIFNGLSFQRMMD